MAVVLFLLEQRHFVFLTNNLLLGAKIVKCTLQAGLLLKCHNAHRNDGVITSHLIFGTYLIHQRSLHEKKKGVLEATPMLVQPRSPLHQVAWMIVRYKPQPYGIRKWGTVMERCDWLRVTELRIYSNIICFIKSRSGIPGA